MLKRFGLGFEGARVAVSGSTGNVAHTPLRAMEWRAGGDGPIPLQHQYVDEAGFKNPA